MNNIQKLIEELKVEEQKAWDSYFSEPVDTYDESCYFGQYQAFCLCIQKLTLLLNAETQTTVKKPEA